MVIPIFVNGYSYFYIRLFLFLHMVIPIFVNGYFYFYIRYYLLTPPLGQDMTQGQFLSGV